MISVNNFTYYRHTIDTLSSYYRQTIVILSTLEINKYLILKKKTRFFLSVIT